MKIILTAFAIAALSTTLAFAQTAATGTSNTTDTTTTTNGAAADKTGALGAKVSKDDCTAMMGKAHAGSDTNWSEAEAKPYLDQMTTMKMTTKTNGTLTSDEFMTACEQGAFQSMK